tara:strand:- start:1298 stop:1648 length:351 start_codon:yes stop_codon:yes gene_type:complete
MKCDCDCHKKDSFDDLKKCKEARKRSKKEVEALKKKVLMLTIVVAIVGTLVGKEGLDNVLEYFETLDKVKQSTTKLIGSSNNDFEILRPMPYGSSPAPSTLGVFALTAMLPAKRRT